MKRIAGILLASLALAVMLNGCQQADAVRSSAVYQAVMVFAGTAWQLELASLADVPADAVKPLNPITMNFGEGVVTGYGGVNRYTATVVYNSLLYTITFSRPASTRMAGPGLEYEGAFFNALVASTNFSVRDGVLTLYDRDGRSLAVLRQVEGE